MEIVLYVCVSSLKCVRVQGVVVKFIEEKRMFEDMVSRGE